MDDELRNQAEAWALAIHEALSAERSSSQRWSSVAIGHGRYDRVDGKPQSGWIDGHMVDVAAALIAAGWSPPEDVVRRWYDELDRWPERPSGSTRQSSVP